MPAAQSLILIALIDLAQCLTQLCSFLLGGAGIGVRRSQRQCAAQQAQEQGGTKAPAARGMEIRHGQTRGKKASVRDRSVNKT